MRKPRQLSGASSLPASELSSELIVRDYLLERLLVVRRQVSQRLFRNLDRAPPSADIISGDARYQSGEP